MCEAHILLNGNIKAELNSRRNEEQIELDKYFLPFSSQSFIYPSDVKRAKY
jgi:hypothetical protein